MKREIKALEAKLTGLRNDAVYWDLRRKYGDYSIEVFNHLRACARAQASGNNHTYGTILDEDFPSLFSVVSHVQGQRTP